MVHKQGNAENERIHSVARIDDTQQRDEGIIVSS